MEKILHDGLYVDRQQSNPKEKIYAERWKEVAERYLDTLLYGPNKSNDPDHALQRDAIVAATIIQWLGSPIGEGFLKEVSDAINKPARWNKK